MKYYVIAFAFLLAGCVAPGMVAPTAANPNGVVGAPVNSVATTIYSMRAGYDTAFLTPAAQYNELPRCLAAGPAAPASPAGSIAAVCSDPKVVDLLRTADAAVRADLDNAEDIARNHPELSATIAQAAAVDAINAAEKLLLTYGVK